MPMPGLARRSFSMMLEEPFARVAAVHEFQHAVAAALHRQMRALAQLRQPRVGLDQIVAVTFRMRRGEADAFQPFNFMNGFEQLDEGGFPVEGERRWRVRESRLSTLAARFSA